jgi:hypothetical protein
MMPAMPSLDFITLFPILLGGLLLFFGRKIFWLFVGAVVFFAVMDAVPRFVHHHESLIFYVAVGAGLVAAVAGYFLQKIAVRLAGFVAGAFVFNTMWEQFAPRESLPWWLPFVVGGILGALLLSFLLDWALIVLSSLTGAFLITQQFPWEATPRLVVVALLSLTGILVQGKMKKGKNKADR